MEAKLRNKYFILRHGETVYQTREKNIVYYWPDSDPPVRLTRKGQTQIKKATKYLKREKIDLIFSSDVFRTRQTAKIIAKELGLKVNYDLRLRDINFGIFQGKPKSEAWAYYKDPKERFKKAPPKGESWLDVRKRITSFLKEIDEEYNGKNILIIGHGDPLWLLEGWFRRSSNEELLRQKKENSTIKVGKLRAL